MAFASVWKYCGVVSTLVLLSFLRTESPQGSGHLLDAAKLLPERLIDKRTYHVSRGRGTEAGAGGR
ncbi:hypothetical protein AMELA_G00084360 [Ameiurus melas]|uniref:Uncharacterized protein n=1 Tax=Ameiurus melas TaxID=219545 RepID=A0A7J6B0P9_AMEME|nr:hypothetical protein AMELA_G00084360 [Ameiurus melas]